MGNRFFIRAAVSWFVLVNLPQFVPALNRTDPYVFGLPFNIFWIWGLNALITVLTIIAIVKWWKIPNIDFEHLRELVKENDLEVKN